MTLRPTTHARRVSTWLPVVAAIIAVSGVGMAAQLASRPAEQWRRVLDSPERVAALRVDDVIARLTLRPTDVVADLGAGTGPFAVAFARAVPAGVVYAVEVDEGFLPLISERARTAGVVNVQAVLGAFTDPKLPGSVDVAFMHDVLHHIADPAAYVRTLTRYLKKDARVAVIDFHPDRSPHRDQPAMLASSEQARRLFAVAGLKPVADIALYDDKWFLVFSR